MSAHGVLPFCRRMIPEDHSFPIFPYNLPKNGLILEFVSRLNILAINQNDAIRDFTAPHTIDPIF